MDPRILKHRNQETALREIAERRDRVDSYPYEIQFSGEHRCNLRCIQCGATIERNQGLVPLMDQRLPQRSLERFEKLRPQIPYWQWLSLTGSGETLINPDLPAILDILVDTDHDCSVAFNTNGTLWTREKAKMIVEAGVHAIRFSIDGATKETFERIRVNAKFEKVLDGIRTLRSVRDELGATRPLITFSCNFMRQNIEELPMLVDLAHELGAVELIANNTIIDGPEMQHEALSSFRPLVARMLRAGQQRAKELDIKLVNQLLDDAEAEQYLEAEQTPAAKLGENVAAVKSAVKPVEKPAEKSAPSVSPATPSVPDEPEAKREPKPDAKPSAPAASPCATTATESESIAELVLPPLEGIPDDMPEIVKACQRPWTGLYVENNGFVKVCCFDVKPIGNIDEQSFDEIWNGPLARELRRSFLEDRPPEGCRNCFIFAAKRPSKDVFVRPSGAMRCHMDAPGFDPRVLGTTTVHGWALDRAGVERVELSIDGDLHAVTAYGHSRPDVEEAFPGYPNGSACGFRYDLDTSTLSVGEHLLSVSVYNHEGELGEGPKRAIMVAR